MDHSMVLYKERAHQSNKLIHYPNKLIHYPIIISYYSDNVKTYTLLFGSV